MKVSSSIVIVFSITVFIFIIAGIAEVSSTNEIALGEELKSKPKDWIVEDIRGNSSETIYLACNLIIKATGNLTLDNVTLIFNCTSDGEYHIEIENGGELYICNNSTITANEPKYHYLFWVWGGAKLVMENSSLKHCGYKGNAESDYGLYICSSNVLIRNCILEENHWGIYYVQNTYQPGKARVENCTITNNGYGISVYGGSYRYATPYIANNTINNSNIDGIYCRDDSSEIIHNTISYNGENGIFCAGSYANIENNTLISNYRCGIGIKGGQIAILNGNRIENTNNSIYCDAHAVIDKITNNTIKLDITTGTSVGIYSTGSSIKELSNNTIENFNEGVKLVCATDTCAISKNNLTKNNIGIYLDDTGIIQENKTITWNNISFSNSSAIYCMHSSPQISVGNNISNNKLAINLFGASAEIDYKNNTFEDNIDGILLQNWYLKVRVRVDSENVVGAQVVVYSKQGEAVLEGATLEVGYIDGWVAEYKKLNDNDRTRVNCTPHTITGYKQYVGNATKVLSITDNGEEALDLTIPELYPEKIVVSGFLSEGQNLIVGVVVVNNGTADAENVIVRFLCDNLPVEDQSISFIAAGRNETAAITRPAVKGNHSFEVQVDPEHSIEEKDNLIENNVINKSIPINAKPVALLVVMPSTVDTYVNVTFNASLSNDTDGIVTEYWFAFGDVGYGNNTGWTTLTAVKHNYTKHGIYIPRIKVRDNFTQDGFVAESDFYIGETITVLNRPPVPYIIAKVNEIETNEANTSDQIIFYGDKSYDGEALYGGATLHQIVNYTWSMGDSKYRYGAIISYSYSDNGTYNVTLTVRDDDNEERTAFLLIVVNNRMPNSLFSIEPVVGYVTTIFTFNASGSVDPDGNIIKYYWDFGDGTTIETSQPIITHQFADDVNYTITLVVQDNDFTNSTLKKVLQILNTPPDALFSLNKDENVAFVNEQVELNASLSSDLDDAISNYTWDFGDGTKGYGMLVNHTYTQPGRYFVTLTVFDGEVNMTHTMIIEVKPLPTWIELHYKEVYLVGAIFCILGAIFFSLRWYEEAKRKEKEVKLWAEKKGAEKEIKIEAEVEEWAEKKKKLKTIDERIKEWARRRAAEKKVKEEKLEEWAKKREKGKVEKELMEWAEKKEAKKKK